MRESNTVPFQFEGFENPTTTPVPDVVFDLLLAKLGEAELKALLYIIRRTFGFKKDRDPISFNQFLRGITTKDGRVLDEGCGVRNRTTLSNALKSLEQKGIIDREKGVDERAENITTVYKLRFKTSQQAGGGNADTHSTGVPPGVVRQTYHPSTPNVPPVVRATYPQQTVLQETVKQETDVVVAVVRQDLENFGIAQSAVTKLIQNYPAQYLQEKLALAQGLVKSQSCLVSQNPAGWLRKAIEEDYRPPQKAKRHRHPTTSKQHAGKVISSEAKRQASPQEEPQPPQTVSTETREPETQAPEHELTWNKALENLQGDLLQEEAARLIGTALLEVTDTTARVSVPNPYAVAWLERRLYRQIAKAMKAVLGRDVDLQFVTSPR